MYDAIYIHTGIIIMYNISPVFINRDLHIAI